MSQIVYGLAVSLAYPSGEDGGKFQVQMISTRLPSRRERGGGSAPCGNGEGGGENLPDDLKAGDAVLVVLGVRFQVLDVDVGQACNTR